MVFYALVAIHMISHQRTSGRLVVTSFPSALQYIPCERMEVLDIKPVQRIYTIILHQLFEQSLFGEHKIKRDPSFHSLFVRINYHSCFSVVARSARCGIFVFQFKFYFLVHILTYQFFLYILLIRRFRSIPHQIYQ